MFALFSGYLIIAATLAGSFRRAGGPVLAEEQQWG